MINLTKFIALLFIVSLSLVGCDKDGNKIIVEPIALPGNIDELVSYWGNSSSDVKKVVINTQGGPAPELLNEEMQDILKLVDANKIDDVLIVNVHQKQTLNPQNYQSEITFDQAKMDDEASVADLAKVIKYFKNTLEAEVHVLGISFGAFMVQELIRQEGVNIADDYLIMVGRLDMDETIWQSFSQGNAGPGARR